MVGTILCTGMMEKRLKMHIAIQGFALIVFLPVVYPELRYVYCEKLAISKLAINRDSHSTKTSTAVRTSSWDSTMLVQQHERLYTRKGSIP